ncbi:hypothetical protein [Rahnella aceris]|nr:hypothetical protein [Rahnella aceris]
MTELLINPQLLAERRRRFLRSKPPGQGQKQRCAILVRAYISVDN